MGGPVGRAASAREIEGGEKVSVATSAAAPRLVNKTLRRRVPNPRVEEVSPVSLEFLDAAAVTRSAVAPVVEW